MTDNVFTPNPLFIDRSEASRYSERLYLSGMDAATRHHRLLELGIQAVINLTKEDDGCAAAGFEYLQIRMDDAQEISAFHLNAFILAMDLWEKEGKRVLVHCHAGISRTSAFTIAWLMHKRHANREKDLRTMWSRAEDEIGRIRPIIHPHYLLKRSVLRYFEELPV